MQANRDLTSLDTKMIRTKNTYLNLSSRVQHLTWGYCGGYTVTELMIAMAAGVVVLMASLQAFHHVQHRLSAQQTTMVRNQDLRIGSAVLAAELRLAGAGGWVLGPPLLTAQPNEIAFLANLEGLQSTLSSAVSASQLLLPVSNGSGWRTGKRVIVCAGDRCAQGVLARNGTRGTLPLVKSLGRAFPAGSQVLLANYIRYYVGKDGRNRPALMRQVDGGVNPLVGDLSRFRLQYFESDGSVTLDPAQVDRVRTTLAVGDETKLLMNEVSLKRSTE